MDYTCNCGKKYKYEGAFQKHKSKCISESTNISNNTTTTLLEIEIKKQELTNPEPKIETGSKIELEPEPELTQKTEKYLETEIETIGNVYKNELSFMKWVLDFRFVNREFKKRAAKPVWMYNIRSVHNELLKLNINKPELEPEQDPKSKQPEKEKEAKSKIIVKKEKKIIKNK